MSLTTEEVANGKVLFVHYYKDQLTFGLYGNKKQYSYLSNEEFTNRVEYIKENMQSLENTSDINLENPFRKLSQHEAYLILLTAHLKGQAIRVNIYLYFF